MARLKLSPTQRHTVDYLRAHGGRLSRWPGGFWTTADTKLPDGTEIGQVWGYDYNVHGAPAWYTTIQTIRALEVRGMLERENAFAQEWADIRRLTWCRAHLTHHAPCAELDR